MTEPKHIMTIIKPTTLNKYYHISFFNENTPKNKIIRIKVYIFTSIINASLNLHAQISEVLSNTRDM